MTLSEIHTWFLRFQCFSCKFIPFWTLTSSSQTIYEHWKVLSCKVNTVNLCFNNKVQIFDSAEQVNTLFILLECKCMNPGIIQILYILLRKSRYCLCGFRLWLDVDFSLLFSVSKLPLKSSFLRFVRSKHDFNAWN